MQPLVTGASASADRPGTVAARGFSPERVAEFRPGIVCVSICAYGHAGPWADRRGFREVSGRHRPEAASVAAYYQPADLVRES